jgi:glycosyltransferase involved in cell wall biosynthesis
MLTTVGPRCGIADYTRHLVAALAREADVATVPVHPGRLNPLWPLAAGARLSRRDVAHVQHTYGFFGVDPLTYTLLVRLLFATIRAPRVLTAHTVREPGPARFDGGLGSRLANTVGAPAWHDAETFRRVDAVVVHAESHRRRLTARGVPGEQVHVIPPGVPPHVPVAPAAVAAFRSGHGLPADAHVVGVFGFVDESKRYADLVEALAALPGRPRLLVAGGPRLPAHRAVQSGLEAAATRCGTRERLVVTGYLDADTVPVALSAMDVVVVPYATDASMSLSLHYALGQGRPVVATDVEPLREVQARGQCVALVPPDDPAALRRTLGWLLDDEGARRRLAAAACAYAHRHTPEAAATRTLAVYAAARARRG